MVQSLKEIDKNNAVWSLTEFVDIVNGLLPQYLPPVKGSSRVREEINPRLVRHYASQGLIDEPDHQGKFAVYTYRQLLQLLIVKRLQNEGIGANAIAALIAQKSNTELESLLSGGVQFNIAPANPALNFLQKVKNRSSDSLDAKAAFSCSAPVRSGEPIFEESQSSVSNWLHLEIAPGLEIQIRSDFKFPKTPSEKKALEQLISQKISEIFTQNKQE